MMYLNLHEILFMFLKRLIAFQVCQEIRMLTALYSMF